MGVLTLALGVLVKQPTASNHSTPTQLLEKTLKKNLDDPVRDEATTFHLSLICEFDRLEKIAKLVAINFVQFSIQLNTDFWIAFTDCAEW